MQDLIFNTRKLSKPYKVAAHGEVRVDASTSGIETFGIFQMTMTIHLADM